MATDLDPIDFYFDFSSPYGYLAADKIDRVADKYGRRTRWHPIMLGVVFKETGNAPNADISGKSEYMHYDVGRLAKMMGLPLTWPDRFPIATLAGARAFYWLEETAPEKAKPFAKACYRRYFGDGVDISSKEAVADVAAELGIDGVGLMDATADPKQKQRVKDETAKAIDRGVFGSPFFFVGDEPFFGSDRFWQIERFLGKGRKA